jgi:hypothetical protein
MTKIKHIPPFPEADELRPCPSESCDRISRRVEYTQDVRHQGIRYSCGAHSFTDYRQFDCANCGELRQNHAFFEKEDTDEVHLLCTSLIGRFAYQAGKLVRWEPD